MYIIFNGIYKDVFYSNNQHLSLYIQICIYRVYMYICIYLMPKLTYFSYF